MTEPLNKLGRTDVVAMIIAALDASDLRGRLGHTHLHQTVIDGQTYDGPVLGLSQVMRQVEQMDRPLPDADGR